ncbi:hypothetical protein ACR80S_12425 [Halomonas sp. MA07-2]|uniref:hypothetical protein n=1 Tax=Halomonas sp. MA07-2 TaxID=3440841 RepID=UPI003EECC5E5
MRARRWPTWAWATACLLFTAQVLAQPADELEIDASFLSEGFSPAVTVSGRALAGVMLEPEGHPHHQQREQRLHVWLPAKLETEGQQLCITLTSRDGLYTGLLQASMERPFAEAVPPQRFSVKFETQIPEYYSRYQETPPPHRLAVLAEIKPDCNPAKPTVLILPVSWAKFEAPGTLSIMVNSNRMRTLFAVKVDPPSPEGRARHLAVECAEIDVTQRIAFDTLCRVDLASLDDEGTLRLDEAQLVRMHGPSPARAIPIPLAQ